MAGGQMEKGTNEETEKEKGIMEDGKVGHKGFVRANGRGKC